ncbi:hypothetical protein XH88_34390 [Bradyrhizobium sp. CCBAU 51627]|nr:hypothetical protein [Bradyrhizobium sp. CCBAU 51627]
MGHSQGELGHYSRDLGDGSDVMDLVDVGDHATARALMRASNFRAVFVPPTRWVRDDASKNIGQPDLRIDAIHFGGDDQAVEADVCGEAVARL